MFQQNYGSKDTRWLLWFMVAMIVYAISTLWPENQIAIFIGGCFATGGIWIARSEIKRSRSQK